MFKKEFMTTKNTEENKEITPFPDNPAKLKTSNRVLTPEAYELVLQMYGAGHKIPAIETEIKRRGWSCTRRVRLWQIVHQECNLKKLDFYRKKYLNSVAEVPISNKRIRLDTIQDVVDKINNTIIKVAGNKKQINNRALKKFLALAKRLNEFLVSAREEMEKKPQFQLVQIQGAEYTMEELLSEQRDIDNRAAPLIRARGITLSLEEETGNTGGDTLPDKG